MSGVVGRKDHVLISMCHLPVHGGLHGAILLNGELCIKDGHAVVLLIFPCEHEATRGMLMYCCNLSAFPM